jgi:hypothetical protein
MRLIDAAHMSILILLLTSCRRDLRAVNSKQLAGSTIYLWFLRQLSEGLVLFK